jgi:hypothetical protein
MTGILVTRFKNGPDQCRGPGADGSRFVPGGEVLSGEEGAGSDRRFCLIVPQTDVMESTTTNLVDLSITGSRFFLQQFLCIRMHAAQLLGDRMLRAVLLLSQSLNPPDIGKKLANLLRYVLAILISHGLSSPKIALAFYLCVLTVSLVQSANELIQK